MTRPRSSAEEAGPPFPAPEPTFPSYQAEFQPRVDELRETQVETDTVLRCYPPGVPRIGPPGKIVQTASEVVLLYNDYNGGYFRIVPLDRPRGDQPPSHLGQAAGRFEGDVLVIETTRLHRRTRGSPTTARSTRRTCASSSGFDRIGDTIDYKARRLRSGRAHGALGRADADALADSRGARRAGAVRGARPAVHDGPLLSREPSLEGDSRAAARRRSIVLKENAAGCGATGGA